VNGAVGFAVFVIMLEVAYLVAGYGYGRGWWWRDRCDECGGRMPCPYCGQVP
jgi:hypothetical protein